MMRFWCIFIFCFAATAFAQDDDIDSLIGNIFTTPKSTGDRSGVPTQPGQTGGGQPPIQPAGGGGGGVQPTIQPAGGGGGGQPIQPTGPVKPETPQNLLPCAGECVPYYLCSNNKIITDGEGILDIRADPDEPRSCTDYIEQCCAIPDKVDKPIIKPVQIKHGCGYRNTEGIGFRITGDTHNEAQYGELPWMVAVLKEEQVQDQTLNVYQCGGSLIHPQVVLTAAHCIDGKDPKILKIRAGEWDTQTKNEIWPHQDRSVDSYVAHEHFHKGSLRNDIALLFLAQPVELAENVQTICMPPQDFVSDGSRCIASGWGKDVFGKEGKYQVILKKIDLPVVPRDQCQSSLRTTRLGKYFELHKSFICAGGEKGKDTCKGDGGSPLVCPIKGGDPNRYYQAGIVAWGIGCGENQVPGVYANVALFRTWINEQMQYKNLDQSFFSA